MTLACNILEKARYALIATIAVVGAEFAHAQGSSGGQSAVVGSDVVPQWVRQAKAGTGNVDFLILGDSNTGFAETQARGGWTQGLAYGLHAAGVPMYGTAVATVYTDALPNGNSTNNAFGIGYQVKATGSFYGGWPLVSASGSESICSRGEYTGPQEVRALWSKGTGTLRPWGAAIDWAFCPTTDAAWTSTSDYLALRIDCPMNYQQSFKYRVVYAKFPSQSTGRFKLRASLSLPPYEQIAQSAFISTESSGPDTWGLGVAELSVLAGPRANASGVCDVRCTWAGGNAAASGVTGPAGFLLQSAYRPVRGTAVSPLEYYSGAATAWIADDVEKAGTATLKTYLGEVRARQIAAGGQGRVVVVVQSGVNGPDNGGQWIVGQKRIIDAMEDAWTQLGFPLNDLAFLLWVSQPSTMDDNNLTGARMAARGWAPTQRQVTFVDMNALASGWELSAMNWFDDFATVDGSGSSMECAHLTAQGYEQLGLRMINKFMDTSCPEDIDGDGQVNGADLGAVLGNWGGSGSGDLSGDGTVNGEDLGMLLGAWGACPQ